MISFPMNQTFPFNRLLKQCQEIDSIQYEKDCMLQIITMRQTKKVKTLNRAWKLRPLIKHFNAAFQNVMGSTFEHEIDQRMPNPKVIT